MTIAYQNLIKSPKLFYHRCHLVPIRLVVWRIGRVSRFRKP